MSGDFGVGEGVGSGSEARRGGLKSTPGMDAHMARSCLGVGGM